MPPARFWHCNLAHIIHAVHHPHACHQSSICRYPSRRCRVRVRYLFVSWAIAFQYACALLRVLRRYADCMLAFFYVRGTALSRLWNAELGRTTTRLSRLPGDPSRGNIVLKDRFIPGFKRKIALTQGFGLGEHSYSGGDCAGVSS